MQSTEMSSAQRFVLRLIGDWGPGSERIGGLALLGCPLPRARRRSATVTDLLVWTPYACTLVVLADFGSVQHGVLDTEPAGRWQIGDRAADLRTGPGTANPLLWARKQRGELAAILRRHGVSEHIDVLVVLVPKTGSRITWTPPAHEPGEETILIRIGQSSNLTEYFERPPSGGIRWRAADIVQALRALEVPRLAPEWDDLAGEGFAVSDVEKAGPAAGTVSEPGRTGWARKAGFPRIGALGRTPAQDRGGAAEFAEATARVVTDSVRAGARRRKIETGPEPAAISGQLESDENAGLIRESAAKAPEGERLPVSDGVSVAEISQPAATPAPAVESPPHVEEVETSTQGQAPVAAEDMCPPAPPKPVQDAEVAVPSRPGPAEGNASPRADVAPVQSEPVGTAANTGAVEDVSRVRFRSASAGPGRRRSTGVPGGRRRGLSRFRPGAGRTWRRSAVPGAAGGVRTPGQGRADRPDERAVARGRGAGVRHLAALAVAVAALAGLGATVFAASGFARFDVAEYATVCGGGGGTTVAPPYAPAGPSPVYLAGELSEANGFGPSAVWHPVDAGTVQLVACVSEVRLGKLVRTCQYPAVPGQPVGRTLNLFAMVYRLTVYEARTGNRLAAIDIVGDRFAADPAVADPDLCRAATGAPEDGLPGRRHSRLSHQQVQQALGPFVNPGPPHLRATG
ncbi:hypothetical protein [Nocardia sp. NPDC019395]|uniref:hypothetical protein n=1 Tax=Nocardia sp. NPDC019395 TaxID=3154686 RepID=UPI0033E6A748